jgi:hypothetical protein
VIWKFDHKTGEAFICNPRGCAFLPMPEWYTLREGQTDANWFTANAPDGASTSQAGR